MKKLIQISLGMAIVNVMLQAMIGGTVALRNAGYAYQAQNTAIVTASASNVQELACPNSHGMSCMRPNVGWNT